MAQQTQKIKGFCKDCFYRAQEPVVELADENGSIVEVVSIDTFCQMTELFIRDDGYCNLFEPKDW